MRRLLLILFLAVGLTTLVACQPAAIRSSVGEAICALGQHGDTATVSLVETGWTFDPGAEAAHNLVAYAGGSDLASSEEGAVPFRNGIAFFKPDGITVSTPETYNLTGSNRSISVVYYREGHNGEPFYCRVRE